jgi:hypothetical protein
MWLVLITGQNDRVIEVEGEQKTLPALTTRHIEIFPDEASAVAYMKQCRAKAITVSYPRKSGCGETSKQPNYRCPTVVKTLLWRVAASIALNTTLKVPKSSDAATRTSAARL